MISCGVSDCNCINFRVEGRISCFFPSKNRSPLVSGAWPVSRDPEWRRLCAFITGIRRGSDAPRLFSWNVSRNRREGFPGCACENASCRGRFFWTVGTCIFSNPSGSRKTPRLLMRFFWQAAKSGAHFHHQAGQVIRSNLGSFSGNHAGDPEVVHQFFEILLDPQYAFPVLKVMLETGFLEAFMPEFAAVRYRVQYDVYHLYTVDEHLLRTVRQLHKMEQDKDESLLQLELRDIFVQTRNRRILYLAALIHDVGKGMGKNHAARGADIAVAIAERLRLDSEETELLLFLIRMHLLLAETALKRDLMDEKPIAYCAMEIGDREKLRLLYLLTIADSRATGPGAWNTWKASLLRELFVKVDRLLLRGDFRGEDLHKQSQDVHEKVLGLVDDPAQREKIARWLKNLSFRYIFSQPPPDIVKHFEMERMLAGEKLVLETRRNEGELWQVTIATRDRPGLFSLIAGVLWSRGLNILSADIFTRESGIALDILIVERLPDPLRADELWQKVKTDLSGCLEDRAHLDRILAGKRKPSILQPRSAPRMDDKVLVDEEASDFYTIVEVYTWDRPGVLHAITDTLFRLDISIQLAKISTPGAQVADVFYVTDLSGNKLLDYDVHEKVREKLLECLSIA